MLGSRLARRVHPFRRASSYATLPGRGLPIGNLTSQYFANHYLDPMDRWLKELLHCLGYVRYMDDFLVWGASAAQLADLCCQIADFARTRLCLALKDERTLVATRDGVSFLGYRLQACPTRPGAPSRQHVRITLARRSRLRFRRKLCALAHALERGTLPPLDFQRRAVALAEFTRCACAANFRRRVVAELENAAVGPAPRDPRGRLEQRPGELPVRQPQLEPPGGPEQQPGLPPRPGPSSAAGSMNLSGGTGRDSSGRT